MPTIDELQKFPAGIDLDLMVAEHILGWGKPLPAFDIRNEEYIHFKYVSDLKFSTDFGKSKLILDKIVEDFGIVNIEYDDCNGNGTSASVSITGWMYGEYYPQSELQQICRVDADSLPLALCRIALIAKKTLEEDEKR